MKNLDYGLGCRLGFPPFLMDFVRGAVPEREMKPRLIAVSVQSMMPQSLIAFLLVWYIPLADEFFPARVALNDICCCVVVAHAGSSHRSEETILVHEGGVVSGRVLRSPDST